MELHLRKKIDREEFDYPALMSALSQYANPRDRITTLLKKGIMIRVKKGLYVFGDELRRRPYYRELLANLIYGPSFVSLDYALAYHGLIPESAKTITSVTIKRPRRFETPVGHFIYRHVPKENFSLGMTRIEQGDVAFLMATPERALADKLRDHRSGSIRSHKDAAAYLFEDLRISQAEFAKMDASILDAIGKRAHSRKIMISAKLLIKLQRTKQ